MPVPNIVQIAKSSTFSTIPGGNLGPGTRALLSWSATFSAPVSVANGIIVAMAARVIEPGANIFKGGLASSIGTVPGGSSPLRTYAVQISYTLASGLEGGLGPVYTTVVPANTKLQVGPPNATLLTLPGAIAWNLYIDGVRVGSMLPNETFTEGGGGGSAPAPTGMAGTISDSTGNAYSELLWVDGGQGGSQFGSEAMAIYYVPRSAGGTPVVEFNAVGFNVNPIFAANYDICIVAAEVHGLDAAFVPPNGNGFIQQGNATNTISVAVSLVSKLVGFGLQTESSAGVADLPSLGTGTADQLFALGTGDIYNPLTPTSPGVTFELIGNITSSGVSGGLPLYFWWDRAAGQAIEIFVVDSICAEAVLGNRAY